MKIRGWDKFQHYKHRKPPWIRLYRELLEDPDWMNQEDEAKALLCELWMVASDTTDGSLPAINALAWRLRRSEETITSALALINEKFLEGASELLAARLRDATSEQSREELQSRVEERESRLARINGTATDRSLPDPVKIDGIDEAIAFEERRFTELALPHRDEIQGILDAVARESKVTPFGATHWLRTGLTGIGRNEKALTRLRLTNDSLERHARKQTEPNISDSNRETMENLRRSGERIKARLAAEAATKQIQAAKPAEKGSHGN